MKTYLAIILACAAALSTGCPGQQTPTGGGAAGRPGGVNPDACGTINTSTAGRKLYAFLVASAELDRASLELETSVRDACKRMARELGVSTDGDTRTVCMRAKTELEANLQVSVKSESRLVTRTTPPVCTTDVDFTASFVAQCEATASADANVRCSGRCGGTCSGACDGQCSSTGANGQCAGQCSGTCNGSCSGKCEGYVDVQASAECEASAEVTASTRTTCTEAKVEVVRENVTVVDDSKFQKAVAAINAGMPALLTAAAKLELAGKALGNWVSTGASLVKSTGELVGQIGEKGICVGGQLAAAVAASADIQARFTVSVEMSASVSASAGASGS